MSIAEVGAGSQRAGSSAVANPETQAFPANVTAGNLVIVWSFSNRPTIFVAGDCTKSAGTATLGTIFLLKAALHSGTPQTVGIWAAKVTASGSLTMAVAGDGSSFIACVVNEYSTTLSWAATTPLEASNSAQGTTATAIDSGNATSAAGALFLGAVAVNNGSLIAFTPGSGWSEVFAALDGTTQEVGETASKIVSSGTTGSFNTVISIAPLQWVAAVAVVKEAAAASPASYALECDVYN